MVRLWDEGSETRVYEPRSGGMFTAEELAEETIAKEVKPRCNSIIVAWVDGVFYKAPEVKHG